MPVDAQRDVELLLSVCRLTAALNKHKRCREGKCRLHTSDDCYLLSANRRYRRRLSADRTAIVPAGQTDGRDGQVTAPDGLMLLNMVSTRGSSDCEIWRQCAGPRRCWAWGIRSGCLSDVNRPPGCAAARHRRHQRAAARKMLPSTAVHRRTSLLSI